MEPATPTHLRMLAGYHASTNLVVHVQHAEERQLYSLERLWRDCPAIELDIDESVAAVEA